MDVDEREKNTEDKTNNNNAHNTQQNISTNNNITTSQNNNTNNNRIIESQALSSDDEEELEEYYFGPREETEENDEENDEEGEREEQKDGNNNNNNNGGGEENKQDDLLKLLGLDARWRNKRERTEGLRKRVKMQHKTTLNYLEKLKTWEFLSDNMLEKVVDLSYSERTKICNAALEVLCRYAATQQPQQPQQPQQQRQSPSRPSNPQAQYNIYLSFHRAFEKTALLREEAPLGRLVDLTTHSIEKIRYKSLWLLNFLLRKCPNEATYISLMDHLNSLYLPHALIDAQRQPQTARFLVQLNVFQKAYENYEKRQSRYSKHNTGRENQLDGLKMSEASRRYGRSHMVPKRPVLRRPDYFDTIYDMLVKAEVSCNTNADNASSGNGEDDSAQDKLYKELRQKLKAASQAVPQRKTFLNFGVVVTPQTVKIAPSVDTTPKKVEKVREKWENVIEVETSKARENTRSRSGSVGNSDAHKEVHKELSRRNSSFLEHVPPPNLGGYDSTPPAIKRKAGSHIGLTKIPPRRESAPDPSRSQHFQKPIALKDVKMSLSGESYLPSPSAPEIRKASKSKRQKQPTTDQRNEGEQQQQESNEGEVKVRLVQEIKAAFQSVEKAQPVKRKQQLQPSPPQRHLRPSSPVERRKEVVVEKDSPSKEEPKDRDAPSVSKQVQEREAVQTKRRKKSLELNPTPPPISIPAPEPEVPTKDSAEPSMVDQPSTGEEKVEDKSEERVATAAETVKETNEEKEKDVEGIQGEAVEDKEEKSEERDTKEEKIEEGQEQVPSNSGMEENIKPEEVEGKKTDEVVARQETGTEENDRTGEEIEATGKTEEIEDTTEKTEDIEETTEGTERTEDIEDHTEGIEENERTERTEDIEDHTEEIEETDGTERTEEIEEHTEVEESEKTEEIEEHTEVEEIEETEGNERTEDIDENDRTEDVEETEGTEKTEDFDKTEEDLEGNEKTEDVEDNEKTEDFDKTEEELEGNERTEDVEDNEKTEDVDENEKTEDVDENEKTEDVEENEKTEDICGDEKTFEDGEENENEKTEDDIDDMTEEEEHVGNKETTAQTEQGQQHPEENTNEDKEQEQQEQEEEEEDAERKAAKVEEIKAILAAELPMIDKSRLPSQPGRSRRGTRSETVTALLPSDVTTTGIPEELRKTGRSRANTPSAPPTPCIASLDLANLRSSTNLNQSSILNSSNGGVGGGGGSPTKDRRDTIDNLLFNSLGIEALCLSPASRERSDTVDRIMMDIFGDDSPRSRKDGSGSIIIPQSSSAPSSTSNRKGSYASPVPSPKPSSSSNSPSSSSSAHPLSHSSPIRVVSPIAIPIKNQTQQSNLRVGLSNSLGSISARPQSSDPSRPSKLRHESVAASPKGKLAVLQEKGKTPSGSPTASPDKGEKKKKSVIKTMQQIGRSHSIPTVSVGRKGKKEKEKDKEKEKEKSSSLIKDKFSASPKKLARKLELDKDKKTKEVEKDKERDIIKESPKDENKETIKEIVQVKEKKSKNKKEKAKGEEKKSKEKKEKRKEKKKEKEREKKRKKEVAKLEKERSSSGLRDHVQIPSEGQQVSPVQSPKKEGAASVLSPQRVTTGRKRNSKLEPPAFNLIRSSEDQVVESEKNESNEQHESMDKEKEPESKKRRRRIGSADVYRTENVQELRRRSMLIQKKPKAAVETEEKKRSTKLQKFFGEDFVDFSELTADPVKKVNSQFADQPAHVKAYKLNKRFGERIMGKSEADFQEEDVLQNRRRATHVYGTHSRKHPAATARKGLSALEFERRRMSMAEPAMHPRQSPEQMLNSSSDSIISPRTARSAPSPAASPSSSSSSTSPSPPYVFDEGQQGSDPSGIGNEVALGWDSMLDSSMMEFEEDADDPLLLPPSSATSTSSSMVEDDFLFEDEEMISYEDRRRTHRLSRFFGEKMDSNKLEAIILQQGYNFDNSNNNHNNHHHHKEKKKKVKEKLLLRDGVRSLVPGGKIKGLTSPRSSDNHYNM